MNRRMMREIMTKNEDKLPEVVLRCACGAVLYGDSFKAVPIVISKCPFCKSDLIQKGVKM